MFTRIAALMLVGLITLGLGAWFVETKTESDARSAVYGNLDAVLRITHQAVRDWFRRQETHTSAWARSAALVEKTKELLETEGSQKDLLEAPAQAELRSLLRLSILEEGHLGFFVIGPDDNNLASARDQNVGVLSLLAGQEGYLERLRSGASAVSLPQLSDVPLPDKTGERVAGRPTMFVGAPIKGDDGAVIAVLVFRIDPTEKFTHILQSGTIGLTGETYAFDGKGRMISESRFEAHLRKTGLLPPGASSILTTELRNPGVDLVSGQSTTTPRSSQPRTLMAQSALRGETGANLEGYRDYRGVPVVGVWAWDSDFNIGLATEMDVSEAYGPLKYIQRFLAVAMLVFVGFMIGLALLFHWSREKQKAGDKRLEALVTNSSDVIAITDADGVFRFVSSSVKAVMGYEPADLLGRNTLDLAHPEDTPHLIECLKELTSVPNSLRKTEYRFRHADGSWHDVESTCRNLLDDPVVRGMVINCRDITDRKEAEETLKQISAERHLALETARISIIHGVGQLIVRADSAFEKIFGWKLEDTPGGFDARNLYANPEEFERAKRDALPVLVDGGTYESEFLAKRNDGSKFWCRLVAKPLDPDRGSEKAIYLVEDITVRKQEEARLREVEERSRLALGAANAGAWSWRIETNEVTWSDEQYRVMGFEPGAIEPSYDTWLARVHPEEREKVEQALNQALEGEHSAEIEYRIIRPDGEVRWLELSARVRRDDAGNRDKMYGIQVDVTERKKNQELGIRLGRIIEESLNEIYVFDADTLKFLSVNHGARANLGRSNAELKSLTPVDIEPEFTRRQFEDLLAPLRNGKRRRLNFETVHLRKDGSTYDVSVHLQYMRTETPPVFAATVEDISQRKLTDQALRQAQKMEAVGQLTGGIAHDFNNLLAIILASVELVGEDLEKDDAKNKLLQRAIRAVERGENLTQRLLAFSRKQTLQPKIIDANELITNTAEILRRTIPESIEIRTDLDTELWTTKVDPNLLEDVLLNIAINARDAMPDGGTLIIRTKNELHSVHTHPEIPIANSGRFVRLSITDSGVGMSADTLEHAFEPFFTTKEVGHGSGLGLSMVYGFAKQSGGHVTIESEVGRGTTVNVCLPAEDGRAVAETAENTDELRMGRGETVLIVEDDPNVREVTVALLKSLGYQVIEAANGQEGLAALENALHVDLLLSDVVLPGGMNGVQLQDEARNRRPNLRTILMSGYADLPQGELPRDVVLLNKPVRRKDLAQSVHAALH